MILKESWRCSSQVNTILEINLVDPRLNQQGVGDELDGEALSTHLNRTPGQESLITIHIEEDPSFERSAENEFGMNYLLEHRDYNEPIKINQKIQCRPDEALKGVVVEFGASEFYYFQMNLSRRMTVYRLNYTTEDENEKAVVVESDISLITKDETGIGVAPIANSIMLNYKKLELVQIEGRVVKIRVVAETVLTNEKRVAFFEIEMGQGGAFESIKGYGEDQASNGSLNFDFGEDPENSEVRLSSENFCFL